MRELVAVVDEEAERGPERRRRRRRSKDEQYDRKQKQAEARESLKEDRK